ncbi:gamma-interferon-responsive lysosomal thiol protein-like [Abrus precatorius]|uniref:Gamma-interferon-responsive lysosomal thiol protein-like n=2 Tax=Magnoliopsida TaxID=3398 RepID=A0A8B8JWH2_ABRPR|nr:gamma-interferon-responsive lysosomal thiol protein-like [Abrus precatorius]
MVSSSSTLSFSLLLYLSFCAFFSHSQSQSQSHDKVSLELYYESLCPYSANFIVNYLPEIFTDDLITIVDLKLVPWGNAKLRTNATFDCQHGPYECLLNTVEACAINIWPELSKHFPFIYCVEDLVYNEKSGEWESCFEKLDLDSKPITQCYNSEEGKELELQYEAETSALQPPHKYVPWVVVDGEPLYEDYENFISYVCKAYKGPHAPDICAQASYLKVKEKAKHSVCYKERRLPTWERVSSTIASRMLQMNHGDAI